MRTSKHQLSANIRLRPMGRSVVLSTLSIVVAPIVLALSACGGGGGGASDPTTPQVVLSGVVAVGAALPATKVTVTDAKGITVTATTSDTGAYEITDPAGSTLSPPFSVKVNTLLGQTEVALNSVAVSRGATANVTPLTTAAVALMNSGGGYNPSTLGTASITTTAITDASAKLGAAIKPLLDAAGVASSSFDPVSTPFQANRTGVDSVMDRLSIDISDRGVDLINRFQLVKDAGDSSAAATSKVTVSKSGATGTLPLGVAPPTQAIVSALEAELKACFAIAADKRVAFTTNGAGRQIFTADSLHASCSGFVHTAYRSQGVGFGQSWLWLLNNPDIDASVKLALVPQYVIDRSTRSTTPVDRWAGTDDNLAYVYNINLIDRNGVTYTKPEVLAKIGNKFVLRGNQRRYDVGVQPQFTKVNDNNGTNNYVEGRLRIAIDPHLVPPPGSDSLSTYGSYQMSADGKPVPKILCAWVTGPLLQNDVAHDPKNPKGGVLMVPPHTDLVTRRDYSAVRIKYPKDFDPITNANGTDRALLMSDCRDSPYDSGGGRWEQAGAETNNAFTIDGAKSSADSSTVFKYYAALSQIPETQYPTTRNRGACTGVTDRGTISGWCAPTRREVFTSDALRDSFNAAYMDPKDVVFTFYLFVDHTYTGNGPVGTSLLAKNSAYRPTPDFTATTFFESAEIVQARIVGAMPFVDKDANSIYAGNQAFRSVGKSMIEAYLGATKATLGKGSPIAGSWSIPAGAEGIDRLGLGGWFLNGSKARIGAATYSDSFALPRSVTSGSFTLSEDWYGFDFATYRNAEFANRASYAYREIWVRSYDTRNRQIQTVENATRP